jgi:hypothetical protein
LVLPVTKIAVIGRTVTGRTFQMYLINNAITAPHRGIPLCQNFLQKYLLSNKEKYFLIKV